MSVIGQALYPLLLWYLNFNGDGKISKNGIALMIVLNTGFDMPFAVHLDMGAFGLGLSTSLSYLLTCAYVFRKFLVGYGWRQTTFAMSSVGSAAIMVMSVQGTFCGMLGAIPAGHANASGSMGGVHYSAKDRSAFVKTVRFALKSCIIFSALPMLLLMFAADDITEIYFWPTDEAWDISKRMMWLFPGFPLLNGICGIFLRACNLKEEYRTQHKDARLVDGMSIIACCVFKNAGKVTLKLDDWLKIKDNFGKAPTLERAFSSAEDVTKFPLKSSTSAEPIASTKISQPWRVSSRKNFPATFCFTASIQTTVAPRMSAHTQSTVVYPNLRRQPQIRPAQ